jgi:hypothetical protein
VCVPSVRARREARTRPQERRARAAHPHASAAARRAARSTRGAADGGRPRGAADAIQLQRGYGDSYGDGGGRICAEAVSRHAARGGRRAPCRGTCCCRPRRSAGPGPRPRATAPRRRPARATGSGRPRSPPSAETRLPPHVSRDSAETRQRLGRDSAETRQTPACRGTWPSLLSPHRKTRLPPAPRRASATRTATGTCDYLHPRLGRGSGGRTAAAQRGGAARGGRSSSLSAPLRGPSLTVVAARM